MKTKEMARLETRVKPDLKKLLRVYCANHGITIQEGVELAVLRLCGKPTTKDSKHAG